MSMLSMVGLPAARPAAYVRADRRERQQRLWGKRVVRSNKAGKHLIWGVEHVAKASITTDRGDATDASTAPRS